MQVGYSAPVTGFGHKKPGVKTEFSARRNGQWGVQILANVFTRRHTFPQRAGLVLRVRECKSPPEVKILRRNESRSVIDSLHWKTPDTSLSSHFAATHLTSAHRGQMSSTRFALGEAASGLTAVIVSGYDSRTGEGRMRASMKARTCG